MRPDTVLLAVDLSNQVYRACSVHRKLKSAEDEFTGGLYGFMAGLASAIEATGADKVVVCEDRKPYLRSATYPDYKLVRKKTRDEQLYELFKIAEVQCRAFCELVGFPLWGVPGFESDDLIAHTVTQHRGRFRRIYAFANDSDLYQLLSCPWFTVYRKDGDLVDRGRLTDLFGGPITPDEHVVLTAITGTHNDVEGVHGIGPVTAYKAIKDPSVLRKLRERHAAVIDRNLALIKLPHPEFPANTPVPRRTARYSTRDLYRWCARYDIHVTQKMDDAFKQVTK